MQGRPGLEARREPLPSRRHIESPAVRVAATVGGWLFAVLLLLPHLTLLLLSFVPIGTWTIQLFLRPTPRPTTALCSASRSASARCSTASGWRRGSTLAALTIALAAGLLVVRRRSQLGRRWRQHSVFPGWCRGPSSRSRWLRCSAFTRPGWAAVVLIGTIWLLPLAYLVRNLPITSRSILAGYPRARSFAGRGRGLARRRDDGGHSGG